MSTPSNGTERCPWDERRLPREMYVKLFVVHFTVIGAYAHLLHLRRDSRYVFNLLLMFASPIAGAALIMSPLIALLIQMTVCRGDRAIMKQTIGILIGRVARDEDGSEAVDVHEPTIDWLPELSSKLVRHVVVQLALLAQCITSIWLFARRVQHGSDALYDHRIFRLAILGTSASIMSIVHLLLRPQYPSRHFWGGCSAKIRWLASLRNMFVSKLDEPYRRRGLSGLRLFGLDWIYACIALSIAKISGLRVDMETHTPDITYKDLTLECLRHVHYYLIFLVLVATQFRTFLLRRWRRTAIWHAFSFLGGLVFLLFFIPISLFVSQLFHEIFLKPLEGGLQMWILTSEPDEYRLYQTAVYESTSQNTFSPDWSRIWTYGHLPASFPYPQAWKDPAADYVWWLA